MDTDRGARIDNPRRLRELRRDHGAEGEVRCAHDPREFERLSGHSLRLPVAADGGVRVQPAR